MQSRKINCKSDYRPFLGQNLGSGKFSAILPATIPILNSKKKKYSRLLLCLCATMRRTHIFYVILCKRNAASNLCHDNHHLCSLTLIDYILWIVIFLQWPQIRLQISESICNDSPFFSSSHIRCPSRITIMNI